MKSYPAFGTVLRQLRLKQGLSQEALAERLEMSSNGYVSRLESNQKNPRLDMVLRIAAAWGMKGWELIKLMEEKTDE